MAEATRRLGDLAQLIRSKNAGPFWTTIDLFFATDADYRRAAAPGVLTEQRIADAYRVDPNQVRLFRLPAIRVIKTSFPRRVTQGAFADPDMHGGQQHVPLAALAVSPTA